MTSITEKFQQNVAQLTAKGSPWEVQDSRLANIDYKTYANAPSSLIDLINEGRKHGDNEFLIYEGERLSFNAFFLKADALACQLQATCAVKPGDSVAIAMRNYPEWMISFVAIALIGGVIVPINSWGQQAELVYTLEDSKSRVAFLDEERFNLTKDHLSQSGITAIVARASSELSGAINFDDLIQQAPSETPEATDSNPESCAIIMYTSGTTGNPKGAISNHINVCQSIVNFEMLAIASAMTDPEPIGKMLERGHPPKVLLALPLFHVSGCHSVFLLSLRAGRPIVMMHKWDKVKALASIQEENITMISAVPTMVMELLEAPEWNDFNTSSMFGFGTGGSAQPPQLGDMIYQKLPDSFPGTGYGMTESNASGFAATGAVYQAQPRSCGLQMPIVDVKILDENSNPVTPGDCGEVFLKSPTNIQGYLNQPEANEETFSEGWLKTGDIGYLNDEGYLFITDRIKDMIIRGGENIYSVEVEAAALSHTDILEAAVFGVPHKTLGEEVALAVYLKPGHTLSDDVIKSYIGNTLAKFKVPSFIYFEDEPLPKTATMKVLKKSLKAKYLN